MARMAAAREAAAWAAVESSLVVKEAVVWAEVAVAAWVREREAEEGAQEAAKALGPRARAAVAVRAVARAAVRRVAADCCSGTVSSASSNDSRS